MAEPLLAPVGGVPKLVESSQELGEVLAQLKSGNGPIAIDAERASGYKYSSRAYLIQIKRNGGGLHLIDPIAVGESPYWNEMSKTFADQEWIIHASTQDLACLREVGINPELIFDTELAGRIAGCERVGLGPLTEQLLGITLAKEHSAVDWSLRPLRPEWLNYAALDVELLIELRNEIEKLLIENKKLNWAKEDFAAILKAPPPTPRKEPWRRTSGIHKIRDLKALAIIRGLWDARNEFAKEIDLAPGRVFNDETLVLIATKPPKGFGDFKKALLRRTRLTSMPFESWFEIFEEAQKLEGEDLPKLRVPSEGLPPPKMWQSRNPLGYARLTHARAAVIECALNNAMPAENLISPEAIRRVCWPTPPDDPADRLKFVESELTEFGARSWQIGLICAPVAAILGETEPLVIEVEQGVEAESPTAESD
ncbi:MAG: HRDC domain-containing protein [Candidatus Nanopelagicaceae bacterium]